MTTVRILADNILIKFGISKCAIPVMKRGRKVKDDGIQISGGITIADLLDGAYKYIEVLKSDKIKMKEMKMKVKQDYYRRTGKVLESSLIGGKMIKAINTWAVAGIVN